MAWELCKLGTVCSFENGDRGKNYPSKSKFVDSGVPFVNAGHLDNAKIQLSEMNYITEEHFELLSRGKFFNGDILFCLRGSLGKCAIVNDLEQGAIASSLVILRPHESLNSQFLLYYLQSPLCYQMIQKYKGGAAQPNLGAKDLEKFLVPIPDLSTQKEVVKKLNKAFADIEQVRANTEQNLRNARELFDSYLQQVFSERGEGYEVKTLKEISLDFGRGKSKHRPRNDESLYGGQYPFIQTGDVRNSEHVIKSYAKTYNDKGLSQSKLWPKGTICITIAANIAETGILDFDACFPDSVIGIVVDPKLTSISYVEFLLQSFKAILKAKGKGSAQDNINLGTFEKMHFPFPSIEKQNEIVTSLNQLLEATIKLEAVYAKKINSLDELKQSLLQQAFTGQLTQG